MGFSFLLIALCAGVVWRRRRLGLALLVLSAVGLFLWSWPPFDALFVASLERRFPVRPFPAEDAPLIVVLAGNIHAAGGADPEAIAGSGTYFRCAHASWLYRNWKAAPILVSGGPPDPESTESAAAVMKRTLIAQGVAGDAITTEERSQTTYENAVYSARILRARGVDRVVLVTEAFHMARAREAFRAQGLGVVPAPCAFRYPRFHWTWKNLAPHSARIELNEVTLHEWIGLAWYRISGRIGQQRN